MIHSRRLRAVTTLAPLGWMLTTAGPIAAKTITYTPQQVYYTYCFSHPPAARIASGDTVVTKSCDASNDLIQPIRQDHRGQLQHSKRPPAIRGLNVNHNHDLKSLFKSTATQAIGANDPWGDFYQNLLARGMKPAMARFDAGAQDGGDRVETLEERRTLESRTIETEIRLSVGEEPKPTQSHARRWPVDSPSARFEVRVSNPFVGISRPRARKSHC